MKKGLLLIIAVLISNIGISQNFPSNTNQKGSVRDFALMLKPREAKKLNKFGDKAFKKDSIKLIIVSVKSMDGLDSRNYAYGLGESWKLLESEKQLLIVLKPKYEYEKGEIYIATSYGGLEYYISDLTVKGILDNSIIPQFKKQKIYKGLKVGIKEVYTEIKKTLYNKT
tara:strand:- start:76 stop:582 length:507 start_codon:yes stop_codon:yes gene_type:complete